MAGTTADRDDGTGNNRRYPGHTDSRHCAPNFPNVDYRTESECPYCIGYVTGFIVGYRKGAKDRTAKLLRIVTGNG